MRKKKIFLMLFVLSLGLFLSDSVYAASVGDSKVVVKDSGWTYFYKAQSGKYIGYYEGVNSECKSVIGKSGFHFATGIPKSTTCGSAGETLGTTLKKVGDDDVYCAEARVGNKLSSPQHASTTYSENTGTCNIVSYGRGKLRGQTSYTWTEEKAKLLGYMMKELKDNKYSEHGKEYVYIHRLVNQFLKLSTSAYSDSNLLDDDIKDAIAKAKTKYSSTSEGTRSVAAAKDFTLENVGTSYSKGVIENVEFKNTSGYDMTVKYSCSNCKLYKDENLQTLFGSETVAAGATSTTKKLYVKTNSLLTAGTEVEVKFSVSYVETAPMAVWYDCGYKAQSVMGLKTGNGDAKEVAVRSSTGIVPSSNPEAKMVVLKKVDEFGNKLTGANVTITLDGDVSPKSCTINSGNSSCNFNFTNNVQSVNYTVHEESSPAGYSITSDYSGSWDLSKSNQVKCYRSPKNNANAEATLLDSADDCNANYQLKGVCLDENGGFKSDITSADDCKSPDDNSSSGNTGNDSGNTGNDSGNTGSDSGNTGNDSGDTYENKWTWNSSACVNTTSGAIVASDKCNYDYSKVVSSTNLLTVTVPNSLNYFGVSKVDASGKALADAKLKICTETEYKKSGINCTAYKNVQTGDNQQTFSWFSVENVTLLKGIAAGKYYLVEEAAAPGYAVNGTAVGFSVSASGEISLLDNKVGKLSVVDKDGLSFKVITISNNLTKMSISKSDMATTGEVPGAKLSICVAYDANADSNGSAGGNSSNKPNYGILTDDQGECIPALLNDGSYATWISTDKPHDVVGLPSGAYFLVEQLAPKGYSTAESILFILKEDGTLTDANGKSLAANKLVMKDAKIGDVKTGMFKVFVIIVVLVCVVGAFVGSFFYINKKKKSK